MFLALQDVAEAAAPARAGLSILQLILDASLVSKIALLVLLAFGLLAARLGLAAVQICRPLPFVEGELPSMKQLRAELFE